MHKILWALFGNDDDPVPPADMWPEDPMWLRQVRWWLRNPLHNLFFYVLGIADKPFDRMVIYPKWESGYLVFRPKGGLYIAYVNYKRIYLPFVSYLGKHVKAYAGWRERGNLGFKLVLR